MSSLDLREGPVCALVLSSPLSPTSPRASASSDVEGLPSVVLLPVDEKLRGKVLRLRLFS